MEHRTGQATLSREELLAAAGLWVDYHRAEGDWLHMDDGQGGSVPVLDLVGGFGSSLLGHHHPEVRDVVRGCLDAQRPVHAQGSHRRFASELKEALASYLHQHTGEGYRVQLLNTGTEAVEAALKHAVYAHTRRVQRLADDLAANVRALRTRLERGEARIDDAFLRACESVLGREPLADLDELLAALAAHNLRVLDEPPFVAAFEHGFHGKTLGALAVTWNRAARLPFLRHDPRAVFITDPASFLDTVARRTGHCLEFAFGPLRLERRPLGRLAALIYEPLRGEGGVLAPDAREADLLHALRRLHPEVPVIADEVQCGLGRTGRPVESHALGLPHDYLVFAKALGGGLVKVSALAVRDDLHHPEFGLLHTSTFAEDDLSCAVGRRALEIIQRDRLHERCAGLGRHLLETLGVLQRRWPRVVKDVRGRGCMLGVELRDLSGHPSAVLSTLSEDGLLGMVAAGYLLHRHRVRVLPSLGRREVLRIQPSAYLEPEALEGAMRAFEDLFERLDRGEVAPLVAHLAGGAVPMAVSVPAAVPMPMPTAPSPRHDTGPRAPVERVGFIAHLIDADSLRHWDPALAGFGDAALAELRQQLQAVGGPRAVARRRLRSPFGREVELVLYGVLMDSEAIEIDRRFHKADTVRRQVHAAYRLARQDGCGVVGFGGHTSIVTANCTEFDDGHPAVTTGNALTVAASLASLRRAARAHGVSLAQAHVAVVGAAGNIGQVHASLLAGACGGLTLLGRAGSRERLRAVAEEVVRELCRGRPGADDARGGLQQAVDRLPREVDEPEDGERRLQRVREHLMAHELLRLAESPAACVAADIVVCASNSATAFLDAGCFATHKPVLVCDVAIPGDVDAASVGAAPHLKLIRGGVVHLPLAPDFELPGMRLGPGRVYACAGETLLLGLAGVRTDFSKGPIRPAQVREIEALARLHGFDLEGEKPLGGL